MISIAEKIRVTVREGNEGGKLMDFNPAPKPKYKRFKPKRSERGKFSEKVRNQIKEHFKHKCQECGCKGIHIHHVKPKGSGVGRGIFSNGLLLCVLCHNAIHNEPSQIRLKYWQKIYKIRHGINYFKDREDLLFETLMKSTNKN